MAAIFYLKMATAKNFSASIFLPTPKNVDIANKIEFLYCLACEILSKQVLSGVHFVIQDGDPKKFSVQMETLVLGLRKISELLKNVYGYKSPKKIE